MWGCALGCLNSCSQPSVLGPAVLSPCQQAGGATQAAMHVQSSLWAAIPHKACQLGEVSPHILPQLLHDGVRLPLALALGARALADFVLQATRGQGSKGCITAQRSSYVSSWSPGAYGY